MQDLAGYLQVILLSGLIGLIFLWVAKANGYFYLSAKKTLHPILLKNVLVVFAIYLIMTMVIAPLLAKFTQSFISNTYINQTLGALQLLLLLTIIFLFYLYCKSQNPDLFGRIWKNWEFSNSKPISKDVLMGVLSWLISFPLVVAVGQFADVILYYFFGFENYEQVAVVYLKETLGSAFMLTVALLTILLAAPIIEEFLFRGCLQSFFKKHMSIKSSIALSSLCFAVFHFAPIQGLGNISLAASLFIFALFLGFIYERQGSLYASIALHMTFNAVSTFRILFFP